MAYTSHSHKDIFNVHAVDLAGVGKAFGFSVPPSVNLNIKVSGQKARMQGKLGTTNGHSFTRDNPYGKRDAKDKRQFSH
jgi:ATP-dependent RNA helicase DDX18/HAS1